MMTSKVSAMAMRAFLGLVVIGLVGCSKPAEAPKSPTIQPEQTRGQPDYMRDWGKRKDTKPARGFQ